MGTTELTISIEHISGESVLDSRKSELAQFTIPFDEETETLADLRVKLLEEMKRSEAFLPSEEEKTAGLYFDDLMTSTLKDKKFRSKLQDGVTEFTARYTLEDPLVMLEIQYSGGKVFGIEVNRQTATIESIRNDFFKGLGESDQPERVFSLNGVTIQTQQELDYLLDSKPDMNACLRIELGDGERKELTQTVDVPQKRPGGIVYLPVVFGVAACIALSAAAALFSVGPAAMGLMITLAVIVFLTGIVGTQVLVKRNMEHFSMLRKQPNTQAALVPTDRTLHAGCD